MRTVPARKGLARSMKIVPDLIRRMQKNVAFTVEGNDTPIDCELAQELNASLVHILRNAFDHGIETAEERSALGKSESARVTLSIKRVNNNLTIQISDDGKGIKPERVKESAVVKGLLTLEQAANLSVEETYQLLFKPGFSTADHVTEISGRGVGLDVVKKSIEEKLHGEIMVSSQPGAGTTFTLNIPVE
jgi:two-component system chemotaxis sensor kinase CheA